MKRNENMTKNEEYNPRGNLALRDQVVALEFVRDEAKNFGADRDKITVMGCGAGAQFRLSKGNYDKTRFTNLNIVLLKLEAADL